VRGEEKVGWRQYRSMGLICVELNRVERKRQRGIERGSLDHWAGGA